MEAATSVKGNLPSGETERSAQPLNDPLQAIQTALINARAAQAGSVQSASLQAGGLGSQEQRTEYERQNDQEQKGDFRQQHNKDESEYLGREREADYENRTEWHRVYAWSNLSSFAKTLQKGQLITLEGKIKYREVSEEVEGVTLLSQ